VGPRARAGRHLGVVPAALQLIHPGVESTGTIFRHAAISDRPAQVQHMGMPEPRIKRYALVPQSGEDGVRRFQLARVAPASGSVPGATRLERMEEIASREREGEARSRDGDGPRD
jgi:hypothetical protein